MNDLNDLNALNYDSPEDRARVLQRIGPIIMEYYLKDPGRQFFLTDLHKYTRDRIKGHLVPDSISRCLRLLRQEGRLDYIVVDRSNSTYRFFALEKSEEDHRDPEDINYDEWNLSFT